MPGPLRARMLGFVEIHFLEVSLVGARIGHRDPVRAGSSWTLELPPSLGGAIVTARVVHSAAIGSNRHANGPEPIRYESGVEFIGLSVDQQAALSRSLRKYAPEVSFRENQLSA